MVLRRITVLIVVLASLAATTVLAQVVIVPGKETGAEVVAVRKYAMKAMNANLRDMRLKLDKGQGTATVANGAAIAAITMTLPPFFVEMYADQYPYSGSNKYYKGAAPVDFQAAAEYLNAQAQKLVRVAADKEIKATQERMERIKKACIACHEQFRGEY